MKKFAKILSLVMVAMLCIVLTACSGSDDKTETTNDAGDTAATGSLDKIKAGGKITIATSPDFPPFESLDGGEIVGIEVDIMKLIAADLGVEVVFEQMDFDSVLPGIQAGKFDVGMSGITVTEKRKENADFTMPYFMASQAIVVLADSEITCKADLEGKKISVQTGTTAESYCTENGYEVLAFQANNDAASALLTGKVDAWVVDNEVAVAMSADHDGKSVVLDEAMTSEPYAFAFAKGSDDLVNAFDESIKKYIEDGTIEGIFTQYGVPYVKPEY